MVDFVHLHVHSQYSFLASTVKLDELPGRVKALGMRAVALTDAANMFGAVRHFKKCGELGIQPLIGCEINLARDRNEGSVAEHLVLLARNQSGYKNLIRLVSRAYTDSALTGTPCLRRSDLEGATAGIVALSGCLGGVAAQSVAEFGPERGEAVLASLRDLFAAGDFFVELQDHGLPEQSVINGILASAAEKLGLPIVATNDVHFMEREDGPAHLYLECIRQGRLYADAEAAHHESFEMYLKSPLEMEQVFREYPAAVKNTLRVAEMCSDLKLALGERVLPTFPVPDGFEVGGYLKHLAEAGLERRLQEFRDAGRSVDELAYRARLDRELGVITGMGYAGYFLIVWDFIREAKSRGIPVGPGRGSGAGSLVAFALGITALDPIPHELLFERFLNSERVTMPDFDVDFCMAERDRVIAYVAEKYGKDSVGQIATFQNLKARSVIKDVARVMGIAAPEAQRVASLVPEKGQGKMCTIAEALDVEPKLRQALEQDPRIAELIAQSQKLEGLTRHAGMHAAGIVISDGPLVDHVPCFKSDDAIITQYDKDDVEKAGLVKFDFLGLKTLTVIRVAERLIAARPDRENRPLDLDRIPFDDAATYALLASGDTTGVFQLESSGMQQLLRSLRPDRFEDVVAAVALYRPGPLGTGMIDDFVGGKHGRKPIRKLHPLVDDLLAPTYGVPVYQEQVMQMFQRLAGYSLGAADVLRAAMSKKKADEMAVQEEAFLAGAVKNGVSAPQAKQIFKEIEGFASYGFNKSHSAAYAVITYQTAYLKAHYPAEFFAAMMTADRDKLEKVVRTIAEARTWGVSVLPPDINASDTDFTVVYGNGRGPARGPGRVRDVYQPKIRFGLGAVRGVGEAALQTIFEARREGGVFRDLFDFADRVDSKRLNKGVLEALVQCGGFDSALEPLAVHRAQAFSVVDRALERSRAAGRDRECGQTTLFGIFEKATSAKANGRTLSDEYPGTDPWDTMELLRREKLALGCYVSGHPLFRYGERLDRIGVISTSEVGQKPPWTAVSVAGMIENYQERLFRGGSKGKAAFFEVEDVTGRVRAKLRGDRIETYAPALLSGEPLLVSGKVSFAITDEPEDDKEPTLLVDLVEPLSDAVLKATRAVTLKLDPKLVQSPLLARLKQLLESTPGSCPVELVLALPEGVVATLALEGILVTPSDAMLSGIEKVFGAAVAELR